MISVIKTTRYNFIDEKWEEGSSVRIESNCPHIHIPKKGLEAIREGRPLYSDNEILIRRIGSSDTEIHEPPLILRDGGNLFLGRSAISISEIYQVTPLNQ